MKNKKNRSAMLGWIKISGLDGNIKKMSTHEGGGYAVREEWWDKQHEFSTNHVVAEEPRRND